MFIIQKIYDISFLMEKTKKLTYKDKLAVWTASLSFFLGWALVVVNFFIDPMGAIADSTLWILGQALLYCGGVIGIAQYAKTEMNKIKHHVGMETDEDYDEE